jgi:hypothetical protein
MSSAPCMWMRGGTSKGGYFLAADLPRAIAQRDAFLLAVMGSPDRRQIDGMGGADPLTSKVTISDACVLFTLLSNRYKALTRKMNSAAQISSLTMPRRKRVS